MGADQHIDWQAAALGTLEWWRDAGVDTLVADEPRDWLARPTPAATVAPVATTSVLPDDLPAFVAWRLGADSPEHGTGDPLGPEGDPASDLVVVVDCPEGGALLDGSAGRLFDRMLAAIGRDRASIYLVPLATVRPLTGRIAPEQEHLLGELLRRHVALAAPRAALCLGQAPSRALIGADAARGQRSLQPVNLETVTVQAVASVHPRFLLEQPAMKGMAWRDLQMLMGALR